MKLITEKSEVERDTTASATEQTFHIRASAKAFSILSDKLYSNKPRAIIRELACNAYDSHVAAGKADVPIEIRLPTQYDPTFYVKDFGLGLSHDQVMTLYTTYFESTKADSDDFIGQLGLGSKSPFSYTSTFIVEAIHNGSHRTYSCFKNEEGLPSIILLNEQQTSEPNGVTVSVAIDPADVKSFVQEAEYVLQYFTPAPAIVGGASFKHEPVTHVLVGSGWKLRDSSGRTSSGAQIVQGFVPYPISKEHLFDDRTLRSSPTAADIACSLDLDITVPIGTVDIAPSREALSYDKHTVKNLLAVLTRIGEEVQLKMSELIADAQDYWTAHQRALELIRDPSYGSLASRMIRDGLFVWNGEPISQHYEVDVPETKSDVAVYRVKAAPWNRTLPRISMEGWPDHSLDLAPSDRVKFMVGYDDGALPLHRIKHFMDTNPGVTIYIIRPGKPGATAQADVAEVVKATRYPHTVIKLSELPARPKTSAPAAKTVKRQMTHKLHFRDYERVDGSQWENFSSKTWVSRECDMNAPQVYVVLNRFTPVIVGADNIPSHTVRKLFSSLSNLQSLTGDTTEVIGLSEKEFEALSPTQRDTWVPLMDHVAKVIQQWIIDPKAIHCLLANETITLLSSWSGLNSLCHRWDEFESLMEEGECKSFIENIVCILRAGGSYKSGGIIAMEHVATQIVPKRYGLKLPTVQSTLTFPTVGTWMHYALSSYLREPKERIGLINAFTIVERAGTSPDTIPTQLLMQSL